MFGSLETSNDRSKILTSFLLLAVVGASAAEEVSCRFLFTDNIIFSHRLGVSQPFLGLIEGFPLANRVDASIGII